EWEGPKVSHNDKDYKVYITNERLILHKERGFISKTDDLVAWDLKEIEQIQYKGGWRSGVVTIEVGGKEETVEPSEEGPNLTAKVRARIS
ncbi:hypothetical protein AKJ66_04445, partial [candidate division MSBL1 archaeon SCGC-AAA259E22]